MRSADPDQLRLIAWGAPQAAVAREANGLAAPNQSWSKIYAEYFHPIRITDNDQVPSI